MPSLSGALPNMRQLYTAEEEFKLIQADFKQLELRVMAAIAKDEVLEAAIATGDVYTEDAKAIFGLPSTMQRCKCKGTCLSPLTHVKDSARHTAKTGHLAFQYGCGLPKFHMQMLEADQSITWRLSETVFHGLRKRYWRTVQYWQEEMARVRRTCYSETRVLFNRRSYPALPELSEVANFPIQGTAAEIANIAMVGLDEELRARYPKHPYMIIMQQHDAFVLEVHHTLVEEVSEILKKYMEQPHIIEGRTWTFPVDIKSGKRFSDT